MSWKLKVFTLLNAIGWLVVVPLLAGALLDPFVDFRGWPGGAVFDDERQGARLAPLPPSVPGAAGAGPTGGASAPSAGATEGLLRRGAAGEIGFGGEGGLGAAA
jgi:hypothetical protein